MSGDLLSMMTAPAKKQELSTTTSYSSPGTLPLYGLDDGSGTYRPVNVPRRAAWFLDELVRAGAEGATTISYPGVRVSDCILKLRRAGVDISTLYEPHGGEFRGRHGRFFLRSKVVRLSDRGAS